MNGLFEIPNLYLLLQGMHASNAGFILRVIFEVVIIAAGITGDHQNPMVLSREMEF